MLDNIEYAIVTRLVGSHIEMMTFGIWDIDMPHSLKLDDFEKSCSKLVLQCVGHRKTNMIIVYVTFNFQF